MKLSDKYVDFDAWDKCNKNGRVSTCRKCRKAEVDLQDFWSMKSIGIKDTGAKSDDDIAMETFKESIKFQDGRYCVTWPWKENIQTFQAIENWPMAD